MRIDNWPLDRIMRLPDWCFGRRWWVGTHCTAPTGLMYYTISEEQLPDKFVVWGVLISNQSPSCLEALRLTIRMGDHIPVDVLDALAMERLFKGISATNILYEFYVAPNSCNWINAERNLIESNGRRLTMLSSGDQSIIYEMTAAVQISALPKEVPDWLISGQGQNLL